MGAIRDRLQKALDRLSFFIVPSTVGMIGVGDAISNTLFVTGKFTAQDTQVLWPVMAVMALGLFATTRARLFTSAFWALGDTKTPAMIALTRVTVSTVIGLIVVFGVRDYFGLTLTQAAAALSVAAVGGAWVEIILVWRLLSRRIGKLNMMTSRDIKIWALAISAVAVARAAALVPVSSVFLSGAFTLAAFGLVYLAGARLAGFAEVRRFK